MSESEPLEADALARAIEENPEAVAAFVERLDVVNELLDVVELGTAALDDRMVEELTETSAFLAESADGLATPETVALAESVGANAAGLESTLVTLLDLERSGTLDDLADVANVASLVMAALDDEMVTTLARTGSGLGSLADTAGDPDTVRGIDTLLTAVGEATDADDLPDRVGVVGLFTALRDPEVQRGLGFVLTIARMIGRDLEDQHGQGHR